MNETVGDPYRHDGSGCGSEDIARTIFDGNHDGDDEDDEKGSGERGEDFARTRGRTSLWTTMVVEQATGISRRVEVRLDEEQDDENRRGKRKGSAVWREAQMRSEKTGEEKKKKEVGKYGRGSS